MSRHLEAVAHAMDRIEKPQSNPAPLTYRNVCDDPIVRQIKRDKDNAFGALADLVEVIDHMGVGDKFGSAYTTAVRLCVRHGMLDREYLDGLETL